MATTLPGGGGTVITFSVQGNANQNYYQDFANAVASGAPITTLPNESTVAGALNVYDNGSTGITTALTTGSQYTFLQSAAPSTLYLYNSNETVVAGASVTVVEEGTVGGERVVFSYGANEFVGSSTSAGGDTIAGGAGDDTIITGGGASTVFAGMGNTLVYLNDTSAGAGDLFAMVNGVSTVYADGAADTVYATATGTIFGNTGSLLLTTDGGTVTLVGGTGTETGFLTAGTDLTFTNSTGDAFAVFQAGAGNETLDGGGAAGGFAFFADTVSGDQGTVVDSVTGGSGYDFFSTGTGTEDITAGSGAGLFEVNSVAGGTITINDFGAGDSVNFFGLDTATEQAFLSTNGSVVGGNYVVTLSDGTTVNFTGITSLNGHLS